MCLWSPCDCVDIPSPWRCITRTLFVLIFIDLSLILLQSSQSIIIITLLFTDIRIFRKQ